MVYHKSVAEVHRRSEDIKQGMKKSKYNHVESKIKAHFKGKPVDEAPEKLRA